MAPVPSLLEEQLIAKAVQEDVSWDKLPKRLKLFWTTNEDWLRHIKEHCIKRRLRWSACSARNACKEPEYYEALLVYLKKQQAPFPYHLADYVCRVMRISPFRYYCDLLYETMRNERSYDTISNFTAADALRETGIGRNQFIDIMNKTRSKLMWKINRAIVKEMLPVQPVEFTIGLDWRVCTVNISTEEHRKLTEEELVVVEKCAKDGGDLVCNFDLPMLRSLYSRGFVYFDAPVNAHDHFQVRSLEGFVSNRNQQHEDQTEELLYALFVAANEQSTVEEQATILQADLAELQAAISLACRLGWAHRVLDYENILESGSTDPDTTPQDMTLPPRDPSLPVLGDATGTLRVAFMVDANLTSFLMMGSFSHSLKQQAVTLYEAGKLGDRYVGELCEDLRAVENTVMEGELQHFADHASSLRYALVCLRTGKVPSSVSSSSITEAPGSPHATPERERSILDSAMEHLEDTEASPIDNYQERTPELLSRPEEEAQTEWIIAGRGDDVTKSMIAPLRIAGGDEDMWAPITLAGEAGTPGLVPENESLADTFYDLNDSVASSGGSSSASKSKGAGTRGKNRVEVVRCESLAGLPNDTLQRLLRRDYTMVVSMVPLSSPLSISPDGTGPVHFGPPLPAAVTPWMKLLLYTAAGAGPVTVALVRSQRLRQLPPPLSGCWKALVWSWDGSSIGGVGAKAEGTLVEGNILLHVINQLLRVTAALVQPLPYGSVSLLGPDGPTKIVTVPLPLRIQSSTEPLNSLKTSTSLSSIKDQVQLSDHPVVKRVVEELGLHTVGFLDMLCVESDVSQDRVGTEWIPHNLQLGIPLFDTGLCQQVCEGALAEHVFEASALEEQRALLANLRSRLASFILDYRANGKMVRATFRAQRRILSTAQSNWTRARTLLKALDMVTPRRSVQDPPSGHIPISRQRRNTRSAGGFSEFKLLGRNALEAVPSFDDEDDLDDSTEALRIQDREEDLDSQVPLPGINLVFDGVVLAPFNLAGFLQGRLPAALVADAGPL